MNGRGSASPAPLTGTRVLSVGHTLPGLYCLALLRDLGATVVRVERPVRAAAAASAYAGLAGTFSTRSLTAGTEALGIDLADADGRLAYRRLAAAAAVVVEGFRPGVAARLGIDHAALAVDRRDLVYAAISGYGQEGPRRERVGHDVNYLAETGVLALGPPAGPPGVPFADGLAGLGAALNIVGALLARTGTGEGAFLDLAIVDGPLFLMAAELEHHLRTGASRRWGETHLAGRYPWYGVATTQDGKRVAVGAVEAHFYSALCRALGLDAWIERQFPAGAELEAAHDAFGGAFAARPRDALLARLATADACVTPVAEVHEVAASDLMERALAEGPDGERLVRSPVRVGRAGTLPPRRPAREVLAEAGFAPPEIDDLLGRGIVEDPTAPG